jgi:tetratricopeptide (TPR) repeat protein
MTKWACAGRLGRVLLTAPWLGAVQFSCVTLARAEEAPLQKDASPPVGVSKQADLALMALLLAVDQRKSNWEPRSRAQLITVLQGLEQLNKRIPQDDPQLGELLRRLAETYSELRTKCVLEAGGAGVSAENRAALDRIARAAHDNALKFFHRLIREQPGYPKLADARFDLALEVARFGSNQELQQALREVFVNHPTSPIAPVAHFVYAEVFRLNGQLAPATAEYRAILNYAAPNPVLCLTRERLNPSVAFRKLKLDAPDAYFEARACERNKG